MLLLTPQGGSGAHDTHDLNEAHVMAERGRYPAAPLCGSVGVGAGVREGAGVRSAPREGRLSEHAARLNRPDQPRGVAWALVAHRLRGHAQLT